MTVSTTPGIIKKFKRAHWHYQTTFLTPLKKLDVFVPAFLTANDPIKEASITIDKYAFEPKKLLALMSTRLPSAQLQHDTSVVVTGCDHVCELLQTALSDWLDFLFVPVPKLFMLYADHDEYSTFYANTKANLGRITASLLSKGFKQVSTYQRQF